jgi:hypothetical protein
MDARVVVLSGSTRFRKEFDEVASKLTMEGVIVLMPNVWVRSDPAYADISPEDKFKLDELHLQKIDLADEVLVVNPGGYIGASTTKEIEYAIRTGRPVKYVEQPLKTEPETADQYE